MAPAAWFRVALEDGLAAAGFDTVNLPGAGASAFLRRAAELRAAAEWAAR